MRRKAHGFARLILKDGIEPLSRVRMGDGPLFQRGALSDAPANSERSLSSRGCAGQPSAPSVSSGRI